MGVSRGTRVGTRSIRGVGAVLVAGLAVLGLSACETPEGTLTLGIVGATIVGGQAPSHEIEQIYYLGVFDPQDQLPPEVYRVRVHGQSSFLNRTKFASGWVPAEVIDSLGTTVSATKSGIEIERGKKEDLAKLKTGRRLMMFGPEGFREAPANHRLVIVMGASPEAFFDAVNEAIGVVAQAQEEQRSAGLDRALFEALANVRDERAKLAEINKDIAVQIAQPQGAMP